ncbi:hypothetical protein PM082_002371 [Marasmius tenuissimus]|nr:hypothetical protein PM082_002371 [Marasmius tenuissimus]
MPGTEEGTAQRVARQLKPMDDMVEMEEEGCRRIDGNTSFPVLIIGNTTVNSTKDKEIISTPSLHSNARFPAPLK